MAQENQGQQNGSSHDELRDIKELFDQNYKRWSEQKRQEESQTNKIRGSSRPPAALSEHVPVTQPAQIPNGAASSNGPPEAKRAETTSETPAHEIHGFKNEILSLKNFLLNQKDSQEFKTVAVVGRYGVGKTALCQKILDIKDVKKAYLPRLWVSMYKDGEEEDEDPKMAVVKRILKSLGVGEEVLDHIKTDARREGQRDEELARLLYVLYLNLWGKKYLIVLDDARKQDEWNERLDKEIDIPEGKEWGTHLSCGFPKGSGGRVIITSRDEELAKKLVGEEHNLHRLYPLSDPDSVWNIYKDAAETSGFEVNPRNERKYREDVMNKSCGIPLAVRMLGKNEPVEEESQKTTTTPNVGQEGSGNGSTATATTQ